MATPRMVRLLFNRTRSTVSAAVGFTDRVLTLNTARPDLSLLTTEQVTQLTAIKAALEAKLSAKVPIRG